MESSDESSRRIEQRVVHTPAELSTVFAVQMFRRRQGVFGGAAVRLMPRFVCQYMTEQSHEAY